MNGVNKMADKLRGAGCLRNFIGMLLLGLAGIILSGGSVAAAQANNQLLAVKMEAGTASPTVLIQTAEAVGYRYTVYDSFDPIRIVIDFPGMNVGSVPESVAVAPMPLKELRVAKFDLASGSLTRVEIVLSANAEYQVALDGKNFRVVFPGVATATPSAVKPAKPKPATAAPATAAAQVPAEKSFAAEQEAKVIKDVSIAPGKVRINTTSQVGRYEHFTLGNPPRLIVDLYGMKPAFKERAFNASEGMKQVRVGAYGDKVRFVFDADGKALPEHMVEKQDTGLAISWGKGLASIPVPATTAAATPAAAAGVIQEPATETKKSAPSGRQVTVDGLDFINSDGRSYVVVSLSAPARISQPVRDGNLVRFEVENAVISRSLRRSIDAVAFPSAVSTVTPYVVNEKGKPAVRIAVELKGAVPYTLVDEGEVVKLVVDDGAYAEAVPPAVSVKEVAVPAAQQPGTSGGVAEGQQEFEQASESQYSGQKISLVFDNADVRSILQLIGDVSGMNILASSDVKGDVTLRLIDVPWDQALDLVLDTANLGKIKEGNVIRVMPASKIRERETDSLKVKKEEVDEGILETRAFLISYSKVEDVKKFLADLSTKRGSIVADPRNKQLIIKDVPSVLDQMAEMVKRVDRPERQVMIEARIVEANTNFARQLGVKWNFQSTEEMENKDFYNGSVGLGGGFVIPVTNPAAAGATGSFSFGALWGNVDVDLRLSALEASGEGKIISTPRVTTLNGEKALISQGTKIPYTTTSDQGTNVSFESAELKLDVTPEINPDGSVILDIKASNSAVGTIYQTSNGETPSIDEKKAETKVLVRDGQTTVIGGIFVEQERDSETGVPLLKDVPYLGHLFKSSSKAKERRELLIFITPRILES